MTCLNATCHAEADECHDSCVPDCFGLASHFGESLRCRDYCLNIGAPCVQANACPQVAIPPRPSRPIPTATERTETAPALRMMFRRADGQIIEDLYHYSVTGTPSEAKQKATAKRRSRSHPR